MASFDKFISSLERDFGPQGKGKKFEVFCKWFLQHDPQWSRVVDEVWHFEEYPDQWQTTDLGTDLVFKDKQGEIWAVQAKCFDEKYSTKKDDMNTFLADSGRKQVSRRLWLHTTNKIDAKALQTSKDQEKPVVFFNLDDFREAEIDYPDSFGDLFKAKVKAKPTPDKHQEIAIKDVVEGFSKADRGQLIMACGTGKTFTTLWIKEALGANSTLVLLPSLGLLSQTLHEWAWAGNTGFDILNVCSDKSVGRDPEDLKTADAPFRVTSDAEEIQAFLKNPNPKVLFCTYQSSGLIAEVQSKKSIPAFDLVIADEAHRCAGKVSSDYANVLNGERIKADRRLFTTATPRFFGESKKRAAKDRDLELIDMNDTALFGKVFHRLSFGEAINYRPEPLLNDYRVVIVGVDEPMVKLWIKDYEWVDIGDGNVTDARTLAAKIALIKAMKDYDLKRLISFHRLVSLAKEFSETFTDTIDFVDPSQQPNGKIFSDHVSGKMKASDRKEKITRLRTLNQMDRGLLSNAKCLSEGVDVPALDAVAFVDPKGSQIDIIQSVGRAIRKVRGAKSESKGTIILPVFLEEGESAEEVIEKSNFKPIWDVLKALKAHDEELSEVLDDYRFNLGKNPSKNKEKISDKIIFDIPLKIGSGFSQALATKIVEFTTNPWLFWYGLLQRFKEREGHCDVLFSHEEDGHKLGNWVVNQRQNKFLSPQYRDLLNELGFSWNTRVDAWEEGFAALLNFHKREGNFSVPKNHKEPGYSKNLSNWVDKLRNPKFTLPIEKRNRLNEIGFVWNLIDRAWEDNFQKLQAYQKENGNCRVPHTYKKDPSLGRWVNKQRNEKKDKLTEDQRSRLDHLGFDWDPNQTDWLEGYNALIRFFKREKHMSISNNHIEPGYDKDLASWVGKQRSIKDKLSTERLAKLNKIGFPWDPRAEIWNMNLAKVEQFKKREGHCRVPYGHQEDGIKIGSWLGTQRYNRKKEILSEERIQILNKLGILWNP